MNRQKRTREEKCRQAATCLRKKWEGLEERDAAIAARLPMNQNLTRAEVAEFLGMRGGQLDNELQNLRIMKFLRHVRKNCYRRIK